MPCYKEWYEQGRLFAISKLTWNGLVSATHLSSKIYKEKVGLLEADCKISYYNQKKQYCTVLRPEQGCEDALSGKSRQKLESLAMLILEASD